MIRTRIFAAALACLACAGLVFAPEPAGAQGKTAPQADDFGAARALFNAGKYEEALPLLRSVYARSSSPNARLYLARCLRKLDRNVEAYDEMAGTVREATQRAEGESKYAQTRDSAAAELALMEPLVGKLVVALADPLPGTTVTLDGKPLETERLGAPLTVAPGDRVVEVTPPHGAVIRREVRVEAHATKTLALTMQGSPAAVASQGAPRAPSEVLTGGTMRKVGFGVAGLGVAGMGLFAVTGVLANQKFSELTKACGTLRCVDPKYGSTVDQGKMLDTLATAGLIAGAVGLVAGTAMIALGGPKVVPPSAAITVVPGGGAVIYTGAF